MKKLFVLILAALVFSGCQSSSTETKPSATTTAPLPTVSVEVAKKEAEHEHSAPHGGALVEFGEEFAHLEFVLDAATGKLTAYALDGEAEKPVRLKQGEIAVQIESPGNILNLKLTGVANALTGETAGDTSEFVAQSDQLKGLAKFDAAIKAVSIKGKDFKNIAFNFPKGSH